MRTLKAVLTVILVIFFMLIAAALSGASPVGVVAVIFLGSWLQSQAVRSNTLPVLKNIAVVVFTVMLFTTAYNYNKSYTMAQFGGETLDASVKQSVKQSLVWIHLDDDDSAELKAPLIP